MYLSAGATKVGRGGGCGVVRVSGVRAFSLTVTYGPFSRDYIQSSDLARKRRLGSRWVATSVDAYRCDAFRAK